MLKEYAARYDATADDWQFLTGDKAEIYQLAREGFKGYVGESADPAIRFEHSGNFALVDQDGYIRSRKDAYGNWMFVYNGITENDIAAQIEEITQDAETLLNK